MSLSFSEKSSDLRWGYCYETDTRKAFLFSGLVDPSFFGSIAALLNYTSFFLVQTACLHLVVVKIFIMRFTLYAFSLFYAFNKLNPSNSFPLIRTRGCSREASVYARFLDSE